MMHVVVQVRDLILSNVTSVVSSASNPAKMLTRLKKEIEGAIISLQREHTLVDQRISRLEAKITQAELREADWSDKAKTAMDHGREDLARQALIAREDCTTQLAELKDDLDVAQSEKEQIKEAMTELEAKRADVREQERDQQAADADNAPSGTPGRAARKADAHLSRIAEMETRTGFATEDTAEKRQHASVDQEIDAMRRDSKIDAELAAMKDAASKPARKRAPSKKAK